MEKILDKMFKDWQEGHISTQEYEENLLEYYEG